MLTAWNFLHLVFLGLCTSVSAHAQSSAAEQTNLYCSSASISASLFLHASRAQYVFKSSAQSSKITDFYRPTDTIVADTEVYKIEKVTPHRVLVNLKTSGVSFYLDCE